MNNIRFPSQEVGSPSESSMDNDEDQNAVPNPAATAELDGPPVLPPPTRSPSEEKYMRGLNDSYQHHLDLVDDAAPGTCEWIASHEVWKRWNSLQTPALLWVTAPGGCGKSVLAKYLVGHFESKRQLDSPSANQVCYFFFREGLQDQDDASAALSALLHQLCSSQPQLIQYVPRKQATASKKASRFCSLWETLTAILRDPKIGDITWILDGLDECESDSLSELLRTLCDYLDDNIPGVSRPHQSRLKLVALGRPDREINQALPIIPPNFGLQRFPPGQNRFELTLDKEIVRKDMDIFIRFKMAELMKSTSVSELSLGTIADIEAKFLSNPNPNLLWVSLIFSLVQDRAVTGIPSSELESILNTNNLDDLYEQILEQATLPYKARKALMIVLAAVRPLSLRELCTAIEVHQDHFIKEGGAAARELFSEFGIEPRVALGETVKANNQSFQPGSLIQQGLERLRIGQEGYHGLQIHPEQHDAIPAEIASSSSVRSLDQLSHLLHNPFSTHLHEICGPLLAIHNNKIYLTHHTLREFLLARPGIIDFHSVHSWSPLSSPQNTTTTPTSPSPSHSKWHHSSRLEDANRLLLETCACYLRLFHPLPIHNQNPTLQWSGKSATAYLKSIRNDPPKAFFKYAAFHWVDHYRPVRQELDFAFDYLLNPDSEYFRVWAFVHRDWARKERERLSEEGVEEKGVPIRPGTKREEGKEWTSPGDFGVSLRTATLDDMDRNGWLVGWQRGNGWMDLSETEGLERALEHFGFGPGEAMEVFDEEFVEGERWWKRGGEEGEEEMPDRIKFERRKKRAAVMERLGELVNPLSQEGSIPSGVEMGSFFTTMGSYRGR
ncbi:hypothetical protein QBC34DRAFT_443452 [Podospora aff. communis PSN243]|uniref:NACHT domain-containing protein n=1 Tax=Podospora aff. communis PSN243 TaxID=3040156 RepID=A0AAV9G8A3_9PEZI|nr:hypothetical protein QBC34DRAFT_443452 [Podospora aff. communis PSN243]